MSIVVSTIGAAAGLYGAQQAHQAHQEAARLREEQPGIIREKLEELEEAGKGSAADDARTAAASSEPPPPAPSAGESGQSLEPGKGQAIDERV